MPPPVTAMSSQQSTTGDGASCHDGDYHSGNLDPNMAFCRFVQEREREERDRAEEVGCWMLDAGGLGTGRTS